MWQESLCRLSLARSGATDLISARISAIARLEDDTTVLPQPISLSLVFTPHAMQQQGGSRVYTTIMYRLPEMQACLKHGAETC